MAAPLLLLLLLVLPPVAGPALLAQPPNSSSAETLGAVLKPPALPGTMGVLAEKPPRPPLGVVLLAQPPKSSLLDTAGLGCEGAGAAAGSELAQSLEPHTSAPEKLEPARGLVVLAAAGAGAEGFACVRLKTDEVAGGEETLGAACGGGAGDERSNRSPIEDDC